DGLHARAVAMRKTDAVHGLEASAVRAAVLADRDPVVRGEAARHACGPQDLVADAAVDELMDLGQLVAAGLGARVHAGDELDLRLAEIGGDVWMGERRAERRRVRRHRERAARRRSQTLLLDAAAQVRERLGGERAQAFAELGHAGVTPRSE